MTLLAGNVSGTGGQVRGEQFVGRDLAEAHQERPVAVGHADLGPFVDRIDGNGALGSGRNGAKATGGLDDFLQPPVFLEGFGEVDATWCILGHTRNLLELNSGCKPSEFHSEINSSSYGGTMKKDQNTTEEPTTWNGRLKQARKAQGLSVPQLARRIIGDDPSQIATMAERIYSYEKAKKPVEHPRGSMMADLSKALGLSIEFLRDGNTNMVALSGTAPLVSGPNAQVAPEAVVQTKTRRRIDILGRSAGGRDGRFIMNGQSAGQIFCPPSVEAAANPYAVIVDGTSMDPRYEDGEMVIANPDVPYRKGNYVVVQLLTEDEDVFDCYVKRFVSFNSKELVLEQLNPPRGHEAIMRFPANRVRAIHKLVGFDGK